MMWTSSALLCVTVLLVTSDCNAHSKPNYTRVIETRLPNPATLQLGSSLLTVSRTKAYLIINNSTSGESCKLRVDPIEENIHGRLQATSLNDDRRFLVWGIRKTRGTSRYHTLLIVDPYNCSYSPVSLPTETVKFRDYPVFPPQIVVQERSWEFKVFYPQGLTCSPCSFDYNGKAVGRYFSLTAYRFSKPASHFWIGSYSRSSGYDKYFYAFNFANGTSTVHVLNSTYDTEERIHFNHTVDAASVKTGAYRNTAICYKSPYELRVSCERLDMQLQTAIFWNLPLSGNCNVSDISVTVDSVGNTFIGVLTTCRLHFFVYDVAGELAADLDFGTIGANYTNREVKGIPLGNEFCLEAVVYSDASVKDTWHFVKCVDVSKYIEDSATVR